MANDVVLDVTQSGGHNVFQQQRFTPGRIGDGGVDGLVAAALTQPHLEPAEEHADSPGRCPHRNVVAAFVQQLETLPVLFSLRDVHDVTLVRIAAEGEHITRGVATEKDSRVCLDGRHGW